MGVVMRSKRTIGANTLATLRSMVRTIVWASLWAALCGALSGAGVPAWAATPDADTSRATDPGRAPAYSIYELQVSGPEHDWKSQHYGEIVACEGGIVTHKFRQRFTLQDPSAGSEWAAIEVRGYPVYPTGIEVGDQVDFDNVYVDEYRGATVLQYYSASSHVVNSSGHTLPDPVELSVGDIRYPAHPEDCERYAGMLVCVEEVMTIGALGLGAHEDNYELLGALGDTAWASDYANTDIDSTFYVSSGQMYVRIKGVLQRYTYEDIWDYYQLLPRGLSDYIPLDTGVEEDPAAFSSLSIAPGGSNPGRFPVRIAFDLPAATPVRLEILDVQGRCLSLLAAGEMSAGGHTVIWNGPPPGGPVAATGVYLARLSARGTMATKRLCLIR